MADNYIVQDASQEIQVLSPTTTQEVTRFGIVTIPHNVYASIDVPQKDVNREQATPTLQQYAALIEVSFQHQGVVGMYFSQDVDASGLLRDYMTVIVGYDPDDPLKPGPYTQEVRVPMADFGNAIGYGNTFGKIVDPVYARLKATVDA